LCWLYEYGMIHDGQDRADYYRIDPDEIVLAMRMTAWPKPQGCGHALQP
jgi:hypothetical protein